MAKAKDDAALIRLDRGYDHVVDAIHDGYDVTVREICEALKCSRSYHDAHVRRFVRHIYLSPHWANAMCMRKYISSPSSTLYSRPTLDAMVSGGVVRRRSKQVWLTEALPADAHGGLVLRLKAIADLIEAIEKLGPEESPLRMIEQLNDDVAALGEYVDESSLPEWRRAIASERWVHARSNAAWVDVGDEPPSSLVGLKGWAPPAAMKGFGDTDEGLARELWRSGHVQLTLTLPDGSTRVMYHRDPTPMDMPDALLELGDARRRVVGYARKTMAVQEMPYVP